MSELQLLQLLRLKGLADIAALAASSGAAEADIQQTCAAWEQSGFVKPTPRGLRLTPEGRERLKILLDNERAGLDTTELEPLYEAFHVPNDMLKAAITAWQMRDENTPNDHSDAAYDNGVISRIEEADRAVEPILAAIANIAPRLASYRARLTSALERIRAGEVIYVARPIIDSYHTVWFELHEDLIALSGRTRAAEAAAGRAA
jgi:pyruvate, orthophosphate dikinase